MRMIPGQELKLKVYMKKGTGANHSRWCPVAACAHQLLEENKIRLKFETINDTKAVEIVKEALDTLEKRLESINLS